MAKTTKINLRVISKIIGMLLLIEGLFMLTALPFSFYYNSNDHLALILSALITSGIGALVLFITRNTSKLNIGKREGYAIVSLAWVIISLFGTLPFLLSGSISNFSNAFFETISGFTTTGASIINDIEAMPKGILFWRSMTHWIGGMGIIVLSLAILPILGIGGMQLFVAEVPGPVPDKLQPRIKQTAKRLWLIYVALTMVETVFLVFGGMNLFDALCHAFGTMATGGFSTRNTSIVEFSPYIQYVIMVFMVLAGTNFTLHFIALSGMFQKIWKNEEFKYYILIMVVVGVLVSISLYLSEYAGMEKSLRDAVFQTIAIITTTGFVSADYLLWPNFAWMIMFLLMFSGGCAGSTGGGIKIVRHLILVKNSMLELKRLIHPMAVVPLKLSSRTVSQDIIFNVLAFSLIYILIFGSGTIIMSFLGLDFESAIGSVAATLGNIGPGIGSVGPTENYSEIPGVGKWFLSFLMLLGRLELFTVLILFSRSFWRS